MWESKKKPTYSKKLILLLNRQNTNTNNIKENIRTEHTDLIIEIGTAFYGFDPTTHNYI